MIAQVFTIAAGIDEGYAGCWDDWYTCSSESPTSTGTKSTETGWGPAACLRNPSHHEGHDLRKKISHPVLKLTYPIAHSAAAVGLSGLPLFFLSLAGSFVFPNEMMSMHLAAVPQSVRPYRFISPGPADPAFLRPCAWPGPSASAAWFMS